MKYKKNILYHISCYHHNIFEYLLLLLIIYIKCYLLFQVSF